MARISICRWVSAGLACGLLTSCFVPKYGEFESDAGSPGNSNSGGIAAVGGKSNLGGLTATGGNTNPGGTSGTVGGTSGTAPGGTSATGGAGGSAGSGVKTSVGGTGDVGGASAVGGTSTIGGASTTGGAGSVGGTSSPGGTANTGGKNVGGITSTGGVSSSPAGGTSTSTGGTAAPTGGTATVTGGATSSGGANPTGGSSTTGGVTGAGGTTSAPFPIQISAGYQHACALLSDNSVWCWGDNASGELGISTATATKSSTPVKVQFGVTGATVKAVTAGYSHSCAVFSDATAQCWGANNYGQLGDGTTTSTSSPVVVRASASTPQSNIQSISAGTQFTCAVVLDSSRSTNIVKCWGTGSYGQLGNGVSCSTCEAKYPSTVVTDTTNNTPLSGVSSVSAGSLHACAVLTSGATYCWGYNAYGQLGNGSTTDSNLPLRVLDGTSIAISATDVSAGAFATCALVNSGVLCWGRNDYGQIGNESPSTSEPRPVPVTRTANPIQSVTQISAGSRDACAVLTSGDVYCWGDGASGQLGQDPSASSLIAACINAGGSHCSSTPILVDSLNFLKPNVKVSCGNQFMMAWNGSGSAYGLGLDYNYGQLGDGKTTNTNFVPVPLSKSWLNQ